MDKCRYCGIEYHPMTVWLKKGSRIHVCAPEMRQLLRESGLAAEDTNCQEQARADGYEMRRDLTPKR